MPAGHLRDAASKLALAESELAAVREKLSLSDGAAAEAQTLAAELEECKAASNERATALEARLAVADSEAEAALAEAEHCKVREQKLATALGGVEQMLDIKEEEIGALDTVLPFCRTHDTLPCNSCDEGVYRRFGRAAPN